MPWTAIAASGSAIDAIESPWTNSSIERHRPPIRSRWTTMTLRSRSHRSDVGRDRLGLVRGSVPDIRRARRASCAVGHRALDLGLQLDVAAQEVVVLLAERLRIAALAGLGAPRLGQLVEAIDQELRVGERA